MFYHLFRPRAVNVSHAAKEGGTTDRWCVFNTNKIYPNSIFKSRLDSVRFSIIRLSVCNRKITRIFWILWRLSTEYHVSPESTKNISRNKFHWNSMHSCFVQFSLTSSTRSSNLFSWCTHGYRKPYISVQQKRSICSMYTYIMPTCSRLLICSYMVFYPTYYVQKQ